MRVPRCFLRTSCLREVGGGLGNCLPKRLLTEMVLKEIYAAWKRRFYHTHGMHSTEAKSLLKERNPDTDKPRGCVWLFDRARGAGEPQGPALKAAPRGAAVGMFMKHEALMTDFGLFC